MNEFNPNSASFNHITLFGFMVIFILSVLAGVLISIMLKTTAAYLMPEKYTLPVSQELLQNPLFSRWSAHVSGRVIAKTDSTFTISHIIEEFGNGTYTIKDANDGKQMEIMYVSGITVFRKRTQTESEQFAFDNVSLKDFSIGSVVNGNVKILQSDGQMKIKGGVFIVK
ncbi:hypothetical protein HYW19_03620 [Candidatus Woesearchaeota archaeon]|nr:hypothetical protein [Candidatus Woesearchaeota archaeon]